MKHIFADSREVKMKNKYNKILKSNDRLSDKYRLNDILYFDKQLPTIDHLIEKDPMYLWNLIHQKHSNISLVRNAYAKLKIIITRINPKLVEDVEKKHNHHKAYKRLRKELRDGVLSKDGSRFKKITSRKVIKE